MHLFKCNVKHAKGIKTSWVHAINVHTVSTYYASNLSVFQWIGFWTCALNIIIHVLTHNKLIERNTASLGHADQIWLFLWPNFRQHWYKCAQTRHWNMCTTPLVIVVFATAQVLIDWICVPHAAHTLEFILLLATLCRDAPAYAIHVGCCWLV